MRRLGGSIDAMILLAKTISELNPKISWSNFPLQVKGRAVVVDESSVS
jgi:hypothetical protein